MVTVLAKSFNDDFPGLFPERLTRAGAFIAAQLKARGVPVISPFELYELIWRMYQDQDRKALYLRDPAPNAQVYTRLRNNLRKSGVLMPDPDYGSRLLRVIACPDLPADEITCLADPACHISYLSAMQRWGLTNRAPDALMMTRPDRAGTTRLLSQIMAGRAGGDVPPPVPLRRITHPETVRRRPVILHETKAEARRISVRGTHARIATIGQTFLDMLLLPDACGGMAHVLETWETHARTYAEEILAAVDRCEVSLVRSRAGYILDERLGLTDPRMERWAKLGQRGSSRKLDPSAPFAPAFSEKWMISLNA